MPRRKKLLIVLASVVLLFLVTTGLILPELIQRQAIKWVAENTERTLSLEDVSFNPLIGKLTVVEYRLTEANSEEVFLSYDRLVFDINISSVWKRAVIVDRLQLFNPAVKIIKTGKDQFNFSDFYSARKESVQEKTGGKPLQFAINNFIIHGGSIDYVDKRETDVSHTIRDLELALPFLGNTPALADEFVQPRLSLKIDGAPFAIEGEAKPFADTLEASLQIKLDNIDLPFYSAYLPRKRPIDIDSGKLAVDLDLSYKVTRDKETKLLLGGDLVLTGVSVLDKSAEKVMFLPLAQVSINWADLLSKRASIDQVAVYGMEIFVNRDATGEWNHARLAKEGAQVVDSDPANTEVEEVSADDKAHIELGAFRFRNGVVHFRDEAGKKPFARTIRDIDIDLNDFDTLTGEATPFRVGLHVTDPISTLVGAVAVSGEIGLAPLTLTADVEISKIQLAGIESYAPPESAGILAGGYFDTRLKVNVEVADVTTVDLAGTAGLRALHLIEPVAKSDVLRWESLQLDGIEFKMAEGPPSIRVAELTLNNYLAKILVTSEGKVNLQHMLAETEEPEAEAGVADTLPDPVPTESSLVAEDAPVIAIRQVTLQGGTLEFIDQHMPNNFTAKFLNLGGRISGIDSQSEEPAVVDLRGNLENRSPLKISGGIKPLGETLYADLKIRFDSIELTPMSPYSGNYLGYTIEKGKLYLDLDYKIDGARLSAGNKVFLDQFTFGQRVESEDATGLPVRLAVALLKDGKGEIHLELPVSGSLEDPEFSVVGVVFTILKNLLVKAATSPFKLLAAMLGSGNDDFSTISFPYGVAELQDPEETKLAKLADALDQRPTLKLEVSGYVDRENDPEGLRQAQLKTSLQQLKFNALKRAGKLAGGETAKAMVLDEAERARYLKQVYKKADFPKPRNALGMVKSLPAAEMEKLILVNTPAGEEELQALAAARARVVHEHLVQVQKMPVERVFLKKDDIYKTPDEGASGSRVAFGATVD